MEYSDENSYFAVLEALTDVILNRGGMEWLNIMSKADVNPDEGNYLKLKDELEIRKFNFIELYNLNYQDLDFIDNLEHNIRVFSVDGAKEPDWDFIINAAIALGEYIIIRVGGEWLFSEQDERLYLSHIGGLENEQMNCLLLVSRYWSKPEYNPYSIKKVFLRIQGNLSENLSIN
ncbi:hypothetical protein BK120_33070 [Paenibacillus sp. FSL A5-0031]|uniref:hypothetical protein n=1 Tax=Paenibacillus sp. FSL A5-0031 TaxID=1920420 RepID=UPI00096EB3D2|nr:hypothetical protein [Paenibacillus sp. FSL A5-0031]OME72032.1 hypothetical protein BK120_33070 [Paenibacillus sp. FSL A5-0031]